MNVQLDNGRPRAGNTLSASVRPGFSFSDVIGMSPISSSSGVVKKTRFDGVVDRCEFTTQPLSKRTGFTSALSKFNSAGKAGRTRAYDRYIELFHLEKRPHPLDRRWSSAAGNALASLPAPSAISGRPPPLPPIALATSPTSFPACTLPVRSLLTAEIMEMFDSPNARPLPG